MTAEQEQMLRDTVAHAVASEAKLIGWMMQLRATKYIDFVLAEIAKPADTKERTP